MNWQEVLIDAYNRVPETVERLFNGFPEEDLTWQPSPDTNSIGWLIWHLTRQHDAQVADLMGDQQVWITGGWAEKFNRSPDPGDMGFGHTPEQVQAFQPPGKATLLGYLNAVTERTRTYIKSLSEADLDRELGGPWTPPPTVGVRLVSIMEDAVIHAGQAAYIRGLRQGKGWQPY